MASSSESEEKSGETSCVGEQQVQRLTLCQPPAGWPEVAGAQEGAGPGDPNRVSSRVNSGARPGPQSPSPRSGLHPHRPPQELPLPSHPRLPQLSHPGWFGGVGWLWLQHSGDLHAECGVATAWGPTEHVPASCPHAYHSSPSPFRSPVWVPRPWWKVMAGGWS